MLSKNLIWTFLLFCIFGQDLLAQVSRSPAIDPVHTIAVDNQPKLRPSPTHYYDFKKRVYKLDGVSPDYIAKRQKQFLSGQNANLEMEQTSPILVFFLLAGLLSLPIAARYIAYRTYVNGREEDRRKEENQSVLPLKERRQADTQTETSEDQSVDEQKKSA